MEFTPDGNRDRRAWFNQLGQKGRMFKVIRQIRTGRYYRAGKWVCGVEQAKSFKDTWSAFEFIHAHHLDGVEVVIHFEDDPSTEYDIVLQLTGVKSRAHL